MHDRRNRNASTRAAMTLAALFLLWISSTTQGQKIPASNTGVAVGPQYDSTHVSVAPADMDAFMTSFTATFGGQPSKRSTSNPFPGATSAEVHFVWGPL